MQLTGFIKKTTPVTKKYVNDDGHQVTEITHVPRGLVEVDSEEWLDQDFLVKILDPRVGKEVRVTKTGIKIRDLWFGGVSTGKYKYLKWGQLCSKSTEDPETKEVEIKYWIWVGGRSYRVSPSQIAQIKSLSDDEAKAVSEEAFNV